MFRRTLAVGIAASLLLHAGILAAEQPPLRTVTALDLDRYAGEWHELARYPNAFERDCARDVIATYGRNADGTIRVVNTCRTADGSVRRAEGVARVVEPPAKLEVRFAPAWLAWLPLVWGDYWVLDIAEDYSYAIVGEPARDYLWILARDARLNDAAFERIASRLPSLGYDPERLIRNPSP